MKIIENVSNINNCNNFHYISVSTTIENYQPVFNKYQQISAKPANKNKYLKVNKYKHKSSNIDNKDPISTNIIKYQQQQMFNWHQI